MIILFEKKIKKYVLEKKHGANKAENKFKKNSSIIYRYYNNTRSLTKAKSSPMFQFHYYYKEYMYYIYIILFIIVYYGHNSYY